MSADTIVPDPTNPQSYNRYSYALNNPIRFSDPTGHCATNPDGTANMEIDYDCWIQFNTYTIYLSNVGGFENPIDLIGSGADWELVDGSAWTSINEWARFPVEEINVPLLVEFLTLRKNQHDTTGYYCSSLECIKEELYGGGESGPLIPPTWICGAVVLSRGGDPRACGILDKTMDADACIENGFAHCGTNFIAESILDKYVPGSNFLSDTTGLGSGDWISGEPTGTYEALVVNLTVAFEAVNEFFTPTVYAPAEDE